MYKGSSHVINMNTEHFSKPYLVLNNLTAGRRLEGKKLNLSFFYRGPGGFTGEE